MSDQDSKTQEPQPASRTVRIARRAMAAGGRLATRAWAPVARHGRIVLDSAAGKGSRAKALLWLGAIATGWGAALLFSYALLLIPFTPSIADLKKAKVDQPSFLYSADGKKLATYNRLHREWVPLAKISPHVVTALVSTEDHRFYEHHGVDVKRTLAGAARTLVGRTEGGSTLTQQLARNLYPEEIGRQRSITRKLKEMITAFKIEHAYSKNEILETYLNTVPFLFNAFGIEMAARTYFDKPASRLSAVESATLIGMLKGNSYYNPVLNPERALKRRNVVLGQMLKRGAVTQASYENLVKRPLGLNFERQEEWVGPAPHFAEHVRKWLIDWADRNNYNIYLDGLRIYTTIDSRLQSLANQAVARQMNQLQAVADVEWGVPSERLISTSAGAYAGIRRRVQPFAYLWNSKPALVDAFIKETGRYKSLVDGGKSAAEALAQLRKDTEFMSQLREEKSRLQAGFVAIDPATSHIKAWVGSRDFTDDQYDHVARAQRQPGSTFKPFIYGAALLKGMPADQTFIDQPVDIPMGDGTVWHPTDNTPPSGRPMSMRDGLVFSKNTITAQVMQQVGPKKAAETARKLGIVHSKLDPVPALALGTSPVTPLEMVSAYSTLANGGQYRMPGYLTRITDKNGRVLAQFQNESERAIPQKTAEELVDIMRGVVDRGTGQAIRSRFGIRADVAGKTGTTQNNTDGWFILMHPRLVAGAWVGFNDARITMRSGYWGQGGHNALYVVGDFFQQGLNSRLIDPGIQFPRPRHSVFGPWLDKMEERVEEWLGRRRPVPPPPPATTPLPPPPPPEEEHDTPVDDIERVINQAKELERTYERERRRVEETIEDVNKVIDTIKGEGPEH